MSETLTIESILKVIDNLPIELPQGWVIFGSAALLLNGVTGIETDDIDILVPLSNTQLETDKPNEGIFCSQKRVQCDVHGFMVDVSWGLQVWDGLEWHTVKIEQAIERDGLHYASLSDCMRLMQQFNRPKDLLRLSKVQDFLKASCESRIQKR